MNSSLDQLRWRCRRGTRELDLILAAYLNYHYQQADPLEQARFIELLSWQDDELIDVLLIGKAPAQNEFSGLVAILRGFRISPDNNERIR